ncbi:MAG: diguanylate cyclase [Candidatus Eisenbacteria bacterium]|nr:diguanylate cyclase [Candidatus Eisenbacteria bacterium]
MSRSGEGTACAREVRGVRGMDKRQLYGVFDNLFDAVCLVDPDRRIVFWNESAEDLTGYSSSEMLGMNCRESGIVHLNESGESYCDRHCPLLETDPTDEVRRSHVFLRHREGHMVPVEARLFPFRDEQGRIIGAAEIYSDVAVGDEIRKRMSELESLARLDELTRLANRRHMRETASARLAELERFGWFFGFILMDIDGFERLKEKYGRDAGDDVLKMIARTLVLNTRPFDVVGRWNDDTFAAIVGHLDEAGLNASVERYKTLIEKSELPWGASPLSVTVTTASTLASRGEKAETLIMRAERRLKEAEEPDPER